MSVTARIGPQAASFLLPWAKADQELELHGQFATWDVFVGSDFSQLLNFVAIIACRILAINCVLAVTQLPFKSCIVT